MKKKITLLFLLLTSIAFSQSTDLDKNDLKLSYVKLPQNSVSGMKNTTYSFNVDIADNLLYNKSKNYVESSVTIQGFEKLTKNGFLIISVSLQDPIIISQEVKTIENKSKNSDGVEKVSYTYKSITKFKVGGVIKVTCNTDQSINKSYNLTKENSDQSSEFSLYEDASKYAKSFRNTMRDNFMTESIRFMNDNLNFDYGFVIKKTTDHLWILANKKHPEFQNNATAFSEVKSVFDKMEYNKSVVSMEAELDKTIKYFEGLDKTYAEDDRKHRKIRYSAYYNLAIIYYYLDMPDKSIIWCDKLIANKYDESDGESLKKSNENMKRLFEINKTNTRHMEVDTRDLFLSQSQSAPEVVASNDFSPENNPDYALVYLIKKTNDTISGYASTSDLSKLGTSIRAYKKDLKGKYVATIFSSNEVSKIIISEDNIYTSVPYKESTDVVLVSTSKFVKELIVGKKVSLYQALSGEVIVKKNSDTQGYSNNSLGWMMNSKKKYTELVENCPALLERVNNKEFKNNIESLMFFVKELDKCN